MNDVNRSKNHDRPHLFVLAGNGPCTNRGCEALLVSTVSLLSTAFPSSRFVSSPDKQDDPPDRRLVRDARIDHRPYTYPSRWRTGALRNAIARRLRRYSVHPFEPLLGRASAVLALGGDNFTLDYGRALPTRQLAIGRCAQDHNVPFVVWGASVGPFSAEPDLEAFAADRLRAASLITVRESMSQQYLASIGVERNVVRVADPAFCLEPHEPRGLDAIKRLLEQLPVGVNLSPLMQRYRSNGASWDEDALDLIRAIDRKVDAPILLVPHVTWTISDDHAFLGRLKARMPKTRNPIELVPAGLSASELKWVIGRLGLLIAARTHATVAAFSQAVPTLSIGYSQKALGINTDLFGNTRWVLPVGDATAESIGDRLDDLLTERDAVRAVLADQRSQLMSAARAGADALSSLLA